MTYTTLQPVRDAGEDGTPALAVRGLTTRYGDVTAIDDVTFSVEPGSVVGLVGPDGAGKTTLVETALGLVEPAAGTVEVNGVDVTHAPAHAYRQVSVVLEGRRNVYWGLTPRENLAFFAGLQGIDARDRRDAHTNLLTSLDLADCAGTPVGDLSRGRRDRVALASVLARETPVVFLDEPTLGLDVEASYGLRTRIRELAADGRTVILSSHDLDIVQEVCDRVVVLSEGRVVADRPVSDLLGAVNARAYRVTLGSDLGDGVRHRLEFTHGVERWQTVPGGVRFEVTVEDSGAFYDLVSDLREVDADLVSLSAVEPSLEDTVLHLTG